MSCSLQNHIGKCNGNTFIFHNTEYLFEYFGINLEDLKRSMSQINAASNEQEQLAKSFSDALVVFMKTPTYDCPISHDFDSQFTKDKN